MARFLAQREARLKREAATKVAQGEPGDNQSASEEHATTEDFKKSWAALDSVDDTDLFGSKRPLSVVEEEEEVAPDGQADVSEEGDASEGRNAVQSLAVRERRGSSGGAVNLKRLSVFLQGTEAVDFSESDSEASSVM